MYSYYVSIISLLFGLNFYRTENTVSEIYKKTRNCQVYVGLRVKYTLAVTFLTKIER